MKKKIDILIIGNLNCKYYLSGGAISCLIDEVENFFDVSTSCVLKGDVEVDTFNTADKIVVVTGDISEGGDYES